MGRAEKIAALTDADRQFLIGWFAFEYPELFWAAHQQLERRRPDGPPDQEGADHS